MPNLFPIRGFALCGLTLCALSAWSADSLGEVPRRRVRPAPRAPAAQAQQANPQAQARFEQGVAAFGEGRYREAVELFKEADRLAPSPLLSFNVAKVYERMGDSRASLAAYRDYLRRLPAAENRADVQQRIHELEQTLQAAGVMQLSVLSSPSGATVLIDNVSRGVSPWTGELSPGRHLLGLRSDGYRDAVSEFELPADHAIDLKVALERSARPPPPAPPVPAALETPPRLSGKATPGAPAPLPPPEEPPPVPRWWTWALFGTSAAAFAGAGVFEVSRANLEDEARRSVVQLDARDKYDAMQDHQTVARVLLGTGVVAAIAGGVSLYFDVQGANEAPPGVAFGCDPGGCSLAAGGRF